jgi:hypothetical protein
MIHILEGGTTLALGSTRYQVEEFVVIVHYYMTTSSLSHELVFDPRSDLFQGGGDDMVQTTVITTSRFRSTSGTRDIYFIRIKVNHLLYACSLVLFEDGILLDPSLVCILRCERSYTFIEEESKVESTFTPSSRSSYGRRNLGKSHEKEGKTSRKTEFNNREKKHGAEV